MYKELKDEELAGKIKKDDHQALAEIINRYQNKLYYYILRLAGDADDAHDVVQETFLKVYENIQGFDEERKFSSWVYRIAHNLSINQLKKKTTPYISRSAHAGLAGRTPFRSRGFHS